jgi:deoxyribodipyrimidine photo-lyase
MADAGPVIVWFREDLRLADHPALSAAVATGRPVLPLYVLDTTPGRRSFGAASRWWLDKSLKAHGAALARLGLRLVLRRGPAVEVVQAVAAEAGAAGAVWSRGSQAYARAQDEALTASLRARGLAAEAHPGDFLVDLLAIRSGAGAPYRMFAPFRRAVAPLFGTEGPLPAPQQVAAPPQWPASESLDSWNLHPTAPDWSTGFSDWRPGDAGARARLDRFLDEALDGYRENRELPHVEGTTRLSPHLRFGEISPRTVLWAAQATAAARPELEMAREKLSFEITWREFHHHLLAHRPDLPDKALRPAFERFPFRTAPSELEAWKRGRTGYPIVDAGLRQLWTTGWMHNRVRLIAASFLVKHLLIDWREGERWFWDTLVDADPANNPASWQWVAGAGVDAAPYFRIFNPVTQGQRFDPSGAFVRRWIPELSSVPDRFIHAPWTAPAGVLSDAGVDLGRTYPAPVVDHAFARARALDALRSLDEAGD